MKRLTNCLAMLLGSSLILGLSHESAIARIKPEPTMCFVHLSNGAFRDLSQFCGASQRLAGRFVQPIAIPAGRQNNATSNNLPTSNVTTVYTQPGTPRSKPAAAAAAPIPGNTPTATTNPTPTNIPTNVTR